MTLLFIFSWILIVVLTGALSLMFIWMWTSFRVKVPFIPVPHSVLPDIYKALGLSEGSVLYDLGCGDGRVLFFSAQKNKQGTYIGIENGAFPLLVARFQSWYNRMRGKGTAHILDQDFFKRDLSDATHVFTYLYPNVMDDLLPKLDRELAPGTRLVSMTFKFTHKKPVAEIQLDRSSYKLARTLSIYEF